MTSHKADQRLPASVSLFGKGVFATLNTVAFSFSGFVSSLLSSKHFANISSAIQSTLGKQSALLFAAQILNAAAGLAVTTLLTRSLSVTDFGAYTFVMTVIVFLATFMDFGVGSSMTRLVAIESNVDAQRRKAAISFIAAAALGGIFLVVTVIASFLLDPIFQTNVGALVLLAAPLVIAFPMQEIIIALCRGSNHITFLSLMTVLPRIAYLLVLGVLFFASSITLEISVLTLLITMIVSILPALFFFKPKFQQMKEEWSLLKKEIREYGKEMYSGRIIDGLTNGVDRMLITFFHGVAPVGLYSIAQMMLMPVSMFSRSMGTSAYKRFTETREISKKILLSNYLWCIGSGIALMLACEILIPAFFTDKYASALEVLPYVAIGSMLVGMNIPYNSFLSAQRQGRSIKIMSVTTSSVNLLLNLLLIPRYSMHGAAIAFIASYGLNLAMNLSYYHSHKKKSH